MDNRYDPEGWEREYLIYEEKRWDDLVELRKEQSEEDKNDLNAQVELGDAYVLAKRYEEALTLLTPLHQMYPQDSDVKRVILDILKLTGKTEDEFNWKRKPEVLKLDENLFQRCLTILKKKRKNKRTMFELEIALTVNNTYLGFEIKELETWLRNDPRLKFIEEKDKIDPIIEILKRN